MDEFSQDIYKTQKHMWLFTIEGWKLSGKIKMSLVIYWPKKHISLSIVKGPYNLTDLSNWEKISSFVLKYSFFFSFSEKIQYKMMQKKNERF